MGGKIVEGGKKRSIIGQDIERGERGITNINKY
jgi:hypothetical protein